VATIRFAVNTRRRTAGGDWVDQPASYFAGTVWGAMAQHVAESIQKGDLVLVQGALVTKIYTPSEGPRAGENLSRLLPYRSLSASDARDSCVLMKRAGRSTWNSFHVCGKPMSVSVCWLSTLSTGLHELTRFAEPWRSQAFMRRARDYSLWRRQRLSMQPRKHFRH
jgi:hypothetical protein